MGWPVGGAGAQGRRSIYEPLGLASVDGQALCAEGIHRIDSEASSLDIVQINSDHPAAPTNQVQDGGPHERRTAIGGARLNDQVRLDCAQGSVRK